LGATGPGRTAAEVRKLGSPIGETLTLGASTEVEIAATAFAALLGLCWRRCLTRDGTSDREQGIPAATGAAVLDPGLVSGGISYRSVATFINVHRQRLNWTFGLTWGRAPAHTSTHNILQGFDSGAPEAIFHRHAGLLRTVCAKPGAARKKSTGTPTNQHQNSARRALEPIRQVATEPERNTHGNAVSGPRRLALERKGAGGWRMKLEWAICRWNF
jgi:hypothetical protein